MAHKPTDPLWQINTQPCHPVKLYRGSRITAKLPSGTFITLEIYASYADETNLSLITGYTVGCFPLVAVSPEDARVFSALVMEAAYHAEDLEKRFKGKSPQ